MHYCNLLIKEYYYLKLLLTIVFNVINFKTLCIVHKTVYLIFYTICITSKLLENNKNK